LHTLTYAIVNSRIDYCNLVVAGVLRTVADKLQHVLNATTCIVTSTRKLDRGLFFKLAVTVDQCVNGRAPPYPSGYCVPVVSRDTQLHLRAANRQLLAVPCYHFNTYSRRGFSVAWPSLELFV